MAKKKCGRPDCGCERKTRAFGAATWLAVVAAVAVVAAALWFSLKAHAHASTAAENAATWHPEPAFLLQHQAELQLGAKQVRHIQIAVRVWNLKKAAYDAQFKTYNTDSTAAIAALSKNQAGSGEYGKLLSAFEKSRQAAWAGATETLTPDQVMALDRARDRALSPDTPQKH